MQRVTFAMERTGFRVERNRRTPPDAEDCPILIVSDGGHTGEMINLMDTTYSMQIGIDGAVTADSDGGLGLAANELYAAVITELMADFTLGDAVTQLKEDGLGFRLATPAESSVPLAFFSLDITATFQTEDGVPYVTLP